MTSTDTDCSNCVPYEFVHMVPVGLILADTIGNIEIINPDASRLLMSLNAGLLSTNFFDILDQVDPQLRKLTEKFPETSGFICRNYRILIPEICKKSKVLAIGITIHKLGTISGIDKLKIMISDETSVLNKEKAYRVKTEFLANMSHEIRTPLNAMLGLTQLLERTSLDDAQHDLVQRISSAGEILLRNLNDVLDFSKIESGQMNLQPRDFCLNHVVSNLYKMQADIARHAGLSFSLQMPSEVHDVQGDDIRLSQILLNLTNNALKFTHQGKVTIRVQVLNSSTPGHWFRFEVSDTGIGINANQLKRLFRPFTQLDSGNTRRFDGTGLGLSICKSLIDLMGRSIGVESTEGIGSTFWFEVPLVPAQNRVHSTGTSNKQTVTTHTTAVYKLAGKHVLIVDDNEMNRYMAQRVLRQEGAQTTVAINGQDAVQLLSAKTQNFDVVLMDVQMPIMDGLEATRLVRTQLGLTHLPIIVCSAGVQPEDRELAMTAGANEFIIKPINIDVLTKTLCRVSKKIAEETDTGLNIECHAQPEPSTETLWTCIPGLDGLQVRDQLDSDTESYKMMLGLLIQEVKNALQSLPNEIGHSDHTPALHRLHKLRGGAGSLYAHELVKTCAHLESVLKNEITATLQSAVNAMMQTMHQLIDNVEAALKKFSNT